MRHSNGENAGDIDEALKFTGERAGIETIVCSGRAEAKLRDELTKLGCDPEEKNNLGLSFKQIMEFYPNDTELK